MTKSRPVGSLQAPSTELLGNKPWHTEVPSAVRRARAVQYTLGVLGVLVCVLIAFTGLATSGGDGESTLSSSTAAYLVGGLLAGAIVAASSVPVGLLVQRLSGRALEDPSQGLWPGASHRGSFASPYTAIAVREHQGAIAMRLETWTWGRRPWSFSDTPCWWLSEVSDADELIHGLDPADNESIGLARAHLQEVIADRAALAQESQTTERARQAELAQSSADAQRLVDRLRKDRLEN